MVWSIGTTMFPHTSRNLLMDDTKELLICCVSQLMMFTIIIFINYLISCMISMCTLLLFSILYCLVVHNCFNNKGNHRDLRRLTVYSFRWSTPTRENHVTIFPDFDIRCQYRQRLKYNSYFLPIVTHPLRYCYTVSPWKQVELSHFCIYCSQCIRKLQCTCRLVMQMHSWEVGVDLNRMGIIPRICDSVSGQDRGILSYGCPQRCNPLMITESSDNSNVKWPEWFCNLNWIYMT